MPDNQRVERAKRMKEARLKAAVVAGRSLSQAAMAELVAKALGRVFHQTQWSDYERGVSDPPYDVVVATAKVSELKPEYIAFGSSPLDIDPHKDLELTQEGPESDRARAERQAAVTKEERRKEKDRATRKGRA